MYCMQTHRTKDSKLSVPFGCNAIHTFGEMKSRLGDTLASSLGRSGASLFAFCSICGGWGTGKSCRRYSVLFGQGLHVQFIQLYTAQQSTRISIPKQNETTAYSQIAHACHTWKAPKEHKPIWYLVDKGVQMSKCIYRHSTIVTLTNMCGKRIPLEVQWECQTTALASGLHYLHSSHPKMIRHKVICVYKRSTQANCKEHYDLDNYHTLKLNLFSTNPLGSSDPTPLLWRMHW